MDQLFAYTLCILAAETAARAYAPPSWQTLGYVLIAGLLVLLNGFFVLAEFALVKVRASRIEEMVRAGDRRALLAKPLIAELDSYLSATQLGITVASLGLGWVGEPAFASLVEWALGTAWPWSAGSRHTLSAATAFVVITFLHILLGELAPKSLAIRRAEQCTLAVAVPMRIAYLLFYVPMVVLNGASLKLLRLMGLSADHGEVAHSEQELRMVLSMAQASGRFPLNRLLLVENVFDLGEQTVREVMVPWHEAKYLSRTASLVEVKRLLAEFRFSRYPVLDPATGLPLGYLLMKDLIAAESVPDWTLLIRPLRKVAPGDNLETTLQQLQREGANMAVVMEGKAPVGLVSLEDILEEVVGRIEDEYPRLPRVYLADALANGGVVLDLEADDSEAAIRELAAVIPPEHLPTGVDVARLAVERERQMPTDIGEGVAIPHARCPGLARPLLVLGRSTEGVKFNPQFERRNYLIFLLITPSDRPHLQVFFLSQLAAVAQSEFVRERLLRVKNRDELFELLRAADPAVTG